MDVVNELSRIVARYAEPVKQFSLYLDLSSADELRQHLAECGFDIFHVGECCIS